MAVSIGALRYDIIADTANFKKGITASRKELSSAKRVFLDTRTPAENLGIEIQGLSRLLKKGAIDQETYNRAVKDLKRQANIAAGGIKGMISQVKNASASLKTMAKGFLVFHAGRAAIQTVGEELQRIDEIAKTSRKLGLVTQDLVTLRLAGNQLAGMADSAVDMAIQRMTRRLSEAAVGAGEAQGAIRELGLDAVELNKMGPAEAFRSIAEAIKGLPTEADQLRVAFKLFDSEGASLVNVLKEGSEGLDDMAAKARSLGLTFTDDVAAKAETANDAMQDAKIAAGALGREMTTVLAPAITAASNLLVGLTDRAKSLSATIADFVFGPGSDDIARAKELDKQLAQARARLDQDLLQGDKAGRLALKEKEEMLELRRKEREEAERLANAERTAATAGFGEQLFKAARERRMAAEEIEKQRQEEIEKATIEAQKQKTESKIKLEAPTSAQRGSREEFRLIAQLDNARKSAQINRHREMINAAKRREDLLKRIEEINARATEALENLQAPEAVS